MSSLWNCSAVWPDTPQVQNKDDKSGKDRSLPLTEQWCPALTTVHRQVLHAKRSKSWTTTAIRIDQAQVWKNSMAVALPKYVLKQCTFGILRPSLRLVCVGLPNLTGHDPNWSTSVSLMIAGDANQLTTPSDANARTLIVRASTEQTKVNCQCTPGSFRRACRIAKTMHNILLLRKALCSWHCLGPTDLSCLVLATALQNSEVCIINYCTCRVQIGGLLNTYLLYAIGHLESSLSFCLHCTGWCDCKLSCVLGRLSLCAALIKYGRTAMNFRLLLQPSRLMIKPSVLTRVSISYFQYCTYSVVITRTSNC